MGEKGECNFSDSLFVRKKDPFRNAFPAAAEDAMVNLANLKKLGEWVQNDLRPAVQALGRKAGVEEATGLGLPELCSRTEYVRSRGPPATLAVDPDSVFFETEIPGILRRLQEMNRRSRYKDDNVEASKVFPH